MANSNLTNAKNAKSDEFYTQFYDIEKEINAYLDFNPNVFEGKTVLCPCDDPYESNFFKCFALNFHYKNRKGVFEYILGGFNDVKLLDVRVFDEGNK